MDLSVQSLKIIVLFTLLVTTFLFSMLPVIVMSIAKKQMNRSKRRRFKNALSLLSCYSAGVFLATCLMDLFPEVQENVYRALDELGMLNTYPFAQFVLSFGFFVILIVEQIVLTIKEYKDGAAYQPLLTSQDSVSSVVHNIPGSSGQRHQTYQPALNSEPSRVSSHDGYDSELLYDSYAPTEEGEGLEELTESQIYQDPNSHSIIRSIILLLALSLHSIFEGLAIGLQDSKTDVLSIFAPVALHKSILAFSLGMNFVQTDLSLKGTIKSNICFAITSPIGIAIGIAIVDFSQDSTAALLANGILQGIACGTFLYIVFFEILPHEFMSIRFYQSRLLKVLFLLLGFSTVATLIFFQPDEDSYRCIRGKDK